MDAPVKVFDIDPMGAVRMTQRDHWRPAAQRYFDSRTLLQQLAMINRYSVGNELFATFCIPMPGSWTNKKKALMNETYCQSKPDIDNITKWWLDCLCEEDKHVCRICCNKIWSEKGSVIIYASMDSWRKADLTRTIPDTGSQVPVRDTFSIPTKH